MNNVIIRGVSNAETYLGDLTTGIKKKYRDRVGTAFKLKLLLNCVWTSILSLRKNGRIN